MTALAVALRVRHLGSDLPDFLEEAAPFRTALGMWNLTGGPTDWNPHSFVHPSLSIYLHLLLQKIGYAIAVHSGSVTTPADWWLRYLLDPTPVVLAARMLHVAFAVATVWLAGAVAERVSRGSGVFAGLLTAASPLLVTTSRSVFADTLMATFALMALERMLAWRERGGTWRLALAVIAIGLAAGTKYTGAMALVPLAGLMWRQRGARGVAGAVLAALAALSVFLVTTPYALLDGQAFRADLLGHVVHIQTGHLGESGRTVPALYMRRLLADVGPFGIGLAIGAAWLVRASYARAAAATVGAFALAFLLPLVTAGYAFGYYLIPVIPAAAALAAAGGLALVTRVPASRARTALAALLAVATLGPVLVAGVAASSDARAYTQIEARQWLERRLRADDLVVSEAWGPLLPSFPQHLAAMTSTWFALASVPARRAFLARRGFHAVTLPFTVGGRIVSRVKAPDGTRREIPVFESAADANATAYDPRLLARVDYVVTSGAVRTRFESEPHRFPIECQLYAWLDSTATVAARFEPGGGVAGPVVTVYRLGSSAGRGIAALGPLPPLWWAERVPVAYQRAATEVLGVPSDVGAAMLRDGTAAPWVRTLAGFYGSYTEPFAMQLGAELALLDRCDLAQPLVEGALMVSPGDARAIELYRMCTGGAPRYLREPAR